MNVKTRIARAMALGSVALLVALAASPVVAAQSQLNVRSVGEIFVDAQGRASGQNVATTITEAQGILSGFASLALGKEIFSSVSIEGFAQAEKIQGVGSSSLVLRGSNAVVALYDNINTAMKVQTTAPTTLHYELAGDVVARSSASPSAVDLYRGGGSCMSTGPECYLGSLVLVGGDSFDSRGEALALVGNQVQARMQAGSQAVFLAKPVYLRDEAFQHAVVESAAEGNLAAHYVTEFEGSSVAASQVDYAPLAVAHTTSSAQSVETRVQSRADSSAVLAYDLAYETLPARSSEDVVVFVDGQLAARADTPAQVQQNAQAGIASYYAVVQNGRSEILAATPDFRSTSEHRITIAASANASTESQAAADGRAESNSRAYGDFEYHSNGKLTGDFLTSIIQPGSSVVHSYTSLATRTEVFKSVAIDGASSGSFRAIDEHSFQVSAPQADLTVVDDVYTTMIVEPVAQADATFDLAADVKAHQKADGVIQLAGPNGYLGMLVLTPPDNGAAQASNMKVDAQGDVKAHLEQGSRVIYRSAPEPYTSEDVIAEAIARGELGAQIVAGVQGGSVSAIDTEYLTGVVAGVQQQSRGSFEVDYTSKISTAKSFAFDTRGTALATKTAQDVRVMVDGQAAVLVTSPAAVFGATGYAKYFAETSADGALRVLVNTAAAANQKATVEISSKLDAAAKAAVNSDSFGTFKLFNDGTAVGSFVTMRADQSAGAVSDFTLISTGQQLFASIAASGGAFVNGGSDGLTTLTLENPLTKLEFSDTTSAFSKMTAKADAEVAFRLAAEINAESRAAGVVELINAQGAHLGSLIVTGANGQASAASRFETNAQGQVVAHMEQGAQILFRAHTGIETELSAAQRTMINEAIAGGQIAGQVLVQTQSSLSANAAQAAAAQASASARLEATAHASAEEALAVPGVAIGAAEAAGKVTAAITATYSNDVQMVTAATKDRVDVTIASTADFGKTVIVSLDPATVAGMASGNAEILFDAQVAMQASSYADILNANDDAGVAEYFVLAGEAGTQVLVSIPHFSVHTVTLKSRDASSTPLYMIATLVLGVIVLAETAWIVRRRA